LRRIIALHFIHCETARPVEAEYEKPIAPDPGVPVSVFHVTDVMHESSAEGGNPPTRMSPFGKLH